MAKTKPEFPFFISTEQRPLSVEEFAIVAKIVANDAPTFHTQLSSLNVIGRCGCGECPTVFFQPHQPGEHEQEIASYLGKDTNGGLVGVLLWEKKGLLSQLEFYSADGHDPWLVPAVDTLVKA